MQIYIYIYGNKYKKNVCKKVSPSRFLKFLKHNFKKYIYITENSMYIKNLARPAFNVHSEFKINARRTVQRIFFM